MIKEKGLSQEELKLIACVTMLIDHIGAVLFPYTLWLRIVGRIAFPIYCFLLTEGAHYTRHPGKYAMRLFVGMLLAEWPFDMAFFGGWGWDHQSVMVTLLLGFGALYCMNRLKNPAAKLAVTVPFIYAAELASTDYGGWGVAMIVVFGLTRDMRHGKLLQFLALAAICEFMPTAKLYINGIPLSIELPALLALIPIALYSGKKASASKAMQWGFYLFYPVHIFILWFISTL